MVLNLDALVGNRVIVHTMPSWGGVVLRVKGPALLVRSDLDGHARWVYRADFSVIPGKAAEQEETDMELNITRAFNRLAPSAREVVEALQTFKGNCRAAIVSMGPAERTLLSSPECGREFEEAARHDGILAEAERDAPDPTDVIFDLVADELARARAEYPDFQTTHHGIGVLGEEFRELRAEVYANKGTVPDSEEMREKMLSEAVQVAAMAVRFILDLLEPRK